MRRRLRIGSPKEARCELVVSTYNVLARTFARPGVFPHVPAALLRWDGPDGRAERLLREVVALRADVLCMQELTDYWTDLRGELARRGGLDSVYLRRPSTACRPHREDGCGIFFRLDRFALVDEMALHFGDLHDRVGLIVRLRERAPQPSSSAGSPRPRRRELLVANTHLFWDDGRPDEQLCELIALEHGVREMRARAEAEHGDGDVPLLVCGDLNSVPAGSLHRYMLERFGAPHGPMRSVYSNYRAALQQLNDPGLVDEMSLPCGEPRYTSFSHRRQKTLDYIFYSAPHFHPVELLEIPRSSGLAGHSRHPAPTDESDPFRGGLPNADYPSDHVAILGVLDWTSPPPPR
jgi:mRNA deadenylase 3'-5' endonuclease subunit Ccr4